MNPFEVFNVEEINKINNVSETLENRDYSQEEWHKIESSVLEDIMSKSSKNGDINKARNDYDRILDKIESYTKK